MTTQETTGPSAETIRRALGGFGVEVDDKQVSHIQRFMKTLLHWNQKLNLTAIRDPLELKRREALHARWLEKARGQIIMYGPKGHSHKHALHN